MTHFKYCTGQPKLKDQTSRPNYGHYSQGCGDLLWHPVSQIQGLNQQEWCCGEGPNQEQQQCSSPTQKAKLRQWAKALPAFETKHDITGLQVLLRQEYMSSEESNCGEIEEDTWKAKAEMFEEQGVKALEVCCKNWHSKQMSWSKSVCFQHPCTENEKVNRLYYALYISKFGWTPPSKMLFCNHCIWLSGEI